MSRKLPSVFLASPDGKAEATAWQFDTDPRQPQSQVYIIIKVKRSEGGGSVFVASCKLEEIKLEWLDADTLQITYPKKVEVEEQDKRVSTVIARLP